MTATSVTAEHFAEDNHSTLDIFDIQRRTWREKTVDGMHRFRKIIVGNKLFVFGTHRIPFAERQAFARTRNKTKASSVWCLNLDTNEFENCHRDLDGFATQIHGETTWRNLREVCALGITTISKQFVGNSDGF